MWKQGQNKDGTKSKYFLQRDGWTIAKMNLANGAKYCLWNGTTNSGYFDTAEQAKDKHRELSKC